MEKVCVLCIFFERKNLVEGRCIRRDKIEIFWENPAADCERFIDVGLRFI